MNSIGKLLSGKRPLLVLGLVVLYLIAVFSVWTVCQRDADHKTEELLEYACNDVGTAVGVIADCQLAATAETVIKDMGGELKRLSVEECQRLAKVHGIDEICLIDGRGKIFASSEPTVLGFDMNACDETRVFMACTNKTVPYVSQDYRGSRAIPRATLRKYVGVPVPKGEGFIQIGLDEARMSESFAKNFNEYMKTWQIGESGFQVCVDAKTGRILFDVSDSGGEVREVRGQNILDFGPDPKTLPNDKSVTFRATVFGMPCFCRCFVFLGHYVLTVVPESEFYWTSRKITILSAVILLVVFGIFCRAIGKIETANRNRELARQCKLETERREMNMAKSIQTNVLPCLFPPYPDMADRIDIFARMRTAREVGGDFYDFYFVGPGKMAFVVADVSGKGIPAAMFMMRAKTTLQTLLKGGGDIAAIMKEVNSRLCQGNEANMFVTAWVGIVDLSNGKIEYVNAGHNPPIVRRFDGTFDYLREKHGPPLAAMDGVSYRKGLIDLSLGEGVFLYTDGVTEATNPAVALYGEDRLIEELRTAKTNRSSQELCIDLFRDLDKFADGAEQADDITMLAFKMNGIERTFDASQKGILDAQSLLEEFGNNPKAAVILDEIVSNIVRCSGASTFTTKLIRTGNDLTMVFRDSGRPFDLLKDAVEPDVTATAEERRIGGLGVYMVKKMAKSIGYERTANENILTVTVAL